MHGGSSIGAMGELLYLLLVVWALALPFFLGTVLAAERGRSHLWPLAGTVAGAFAFACSRTAAVERLDTITAATLPLAAAALVSLAFTAAVSRLGGTERARRWRGHRLPSGAPCTLAVLRGVLHVETPEGPLTIATPDVVHDATVVRVSWVDGTLTFLPEEDPD